MDSINKELEDLGSQFVALLISNPIQYQNAVSNSLKYLVGEKNMDCIYVTFNRSFNALQGALTDEGIDTKKVFFVDAVSGQMMPDTPETENCIFVKNPQ
ncbi:hypothetical protein ACFLRC_04110, partial [Candidatus Altiarchaeota archaeon]